MRGKARNLLNKPVRNKFSVQGEANGVKYGLSNMQGWRTQMEDFFTVNVGFNDKLKGWSFFAVFDGHSGSKTAQYCSKHLLETILNSGNFLQDISCSIRNGFLNIDNKLKNLPEIVDEDSGTTVICAFLTNEKIYIANCGDSRAVICSKGLSSFSTKDHKPYIALEKERINKAGGFVKKGRIEGDLSVSRALGDFYYKSNESKQPFEQKISPEPDIFIWDRKKDDEFLILASDGIWQAMKNSDICTYVCGRLAISKNLEDITNQIIDTCYYKGSFDNMSTILVTLNEGLSLNADATKADEELDVFLKNQTKKLMDKENLNFEELIVELKTTNSINFPSGGGLASKCAVIEAYYKTLGYNFDQAVFLSGLLK